MIRIGRIRKRSSIRLNLPPGAVAFGRLHSGVTPGISTVHYIGRALTNVGLRGRESEIEGLRFVYASHAVVLKERTFHLVVIVDIYRTGLALDKTRSIVGGGLELLIGQGTYGIGTAREYRPPALPSGKTACFHSTAGAAWRSGCPGPDSP